jgi:sugar phosphate isomerase/epimerase
MDRSPLRLSAFADEISPDLAEQIAVCRRVGVTHFELRGVEGVNVLDLSAEQRARIRSDLNTAGMGVACIGSPIGKVRIDEPWGPHFDRFKVAVDAAHHFGAPLIRLFSYYGPKRGNIAEHRDEVLRRFAAKVEYVRDADVTMVHENEKDIFGERGDACADLLGTINSPRLRAAFDFANFVQAGDEPLACWLKLAAYTVHIHIKDARADGSVVPPGQGAGMLAVILKMAYDDGYRGFLSLEPHLSAHGQFSGFSGPALFTVAADALRVLCRESRIPLAVP